MAQTRLRIADDTVPVTWLDPERGVPVAFSETAIPLLRCAPPRPHTPTSRARIPLVYCHGNAEDVGTCHAWCRWLAARFVRDVYVYDYTGYGTNRAAASERTVYANITSVLRYLASRGVPEVVVFGRSLGTAPAVYGACLRRPGEANAAARVRGLVLESAFRSIVTTQVASCIKVPRWLDMLCTERRLATCTVPTLLVHGTDDRVVPFAHGEALAEAPCVWGTCFLNRAGHNDIDGTPAWRDEMCAKIDHFLAAAVDQFRGAGTPPESSV